MKDGHRTIDSRSLLKTTCQVRKRFSSGPLDTDQPKRLHFVFSKNCGQIFNSCTGFQRCSIMDGNQCDILRRVSVRSTGGASFVQYEYTLHLKFIWLVNTDPQHAFLIRLTYTVCQSYKWTHRMCLNRPEV